MSGPSRLRQLLPTDNIYRILTADDLPDVLDEYHIYHLFYDPGDGLGLYFSLDNLTLTKIASGSIANPYFLLTATNRVIGSDAGASNTGDDVFLGGAGAGDVNIADSVIAIGVNALKVAAALDFEGSIVIGANAGQLLDDTRDPWILIGFNACAALTGAAFHDANTIIGTNALLNSDQNNLQANVVIGHDACRDMTGAGDQGVINSSVVIGAFAGRGPVNASISNCVLIGRGVCDSMGTGGVSSCVVIGTNAGEDLGGALRTVIVGTNAVGNGGDLDGCTIIGDSAFGLFSGAVSDLIVIGSATWGTISARLKNIVIGNSIGTNGLTNYGGCIIIGHQAGNDMPDDSNVFAIEMPQGLSSSLARPFLFGNIMNGNLALLNIEAMTGGVETGVRIVPSWALAAPVAGEGIFSMYGAGADLAPTTDTDFVHFFVRTSDNALVLRFQDGSERPLASSAEAIKTADEPVTSSTALQNDNALVVTMAAGVRYRFEAYIPFHENGGDILMDFAFSDAPQNSQGRYDMVADTADQPHSEFTADLTTNISFNPTTSNGEYGIMIRGYVRSNATTGGTMQFRWAQNSSNINATIVREGAWMRLEKAA